MAVQFYGHALVDFRHLLAQVPAARMNNQIMAAVPAFVNFNEMIAASQSAYAAFYSGKSPQLVTADKAGQVEIRLFPVPYIHAGWHNVGRFIQTFEIKGLPAQVYGIHAAANIYAHHIRHHFVPDGHGSSNGAALSGMHVGHNTHTASFRQLIAAHAKDLLPRKFVHDFGIGNGCSYDSFDMFHLYHLFFQIKKALIHRISAA